MNTITLIFEYNFLYDSMSKGSQKSSENNKVDTFVATRIVYKLGLIKNIIYY